jgi:F-box domain
MPAPTTSEKELLALSNEVLANIVAHLDPPSAVCLALSCKHLKGMVEDFCNADIGSLIPKYIHGAGSSTLQVYIPTKKERSLSYKLQKISHTCLDANLQNIVNVDVLFSPDRIGLLNLLNHKSEHSHIRLGHARCTAPRGSSCVICSLLVLMESEYRLGRRDIIKELEASGEITYDDEDGIDQGGDKEDDDGRDSGDDNGDDDSGSDNGEDESDDGTDPNESGLDDGDSITINSDSERSTYEDDQIIEDSDINASGDTKMQDEALKAKAPDDQDDQDPNHTESDEEATDSSEVGPENDDNNPSDDGDDSDTSSEDTDDEIEDSEPAPLQTLSSEMLIKIIHDLDPPSAVCLALSCRKFYSLIPYICKTPLWEICPVLEDDGGIKPPPMLQPLFVRKIYWLERCLTQMACKMLFRLLKCVDETLPKSVLSNEYIKLWQQANLQSYRDGDCSYCRDAGHLPCPRSAMLEDECRICLMMEFVRGVRRRISPPAHDEIRDIESQCELVELDCQGRCESPDLTGHFDWFPPHHRLP